MDAETATRLAADHQPWLIGRLIPRLRYCRECQPRQPWPCRTYQVATAVRRSQSPDHD